ncbi:MAG: hypothetical protein L3J89_05805 [Gammaproteobacteria bacterium]|nr:hypothetical protein [Gammaproteobacteria bacterium]
MIKFKKLIPLVITMILISFSSVSVAGNPHHHSSKKFKVKCSKVELLHAALAMIPPIGPASGPAHFIIGGEPMLATATVELIAPPEPQLDGTANILVLLQYDFGGGDILLAFSRGVLTQTDRPGVFDNNAKINYTGGFGRYENAYGRFDGKGTLNFSEFSIHMAGIGEVCNV